MQQKTTFIFYKFLQTLEGEGMGNRDSTFCTLGKNVDNWNQPLTTLTTDKKKTTNKTFAPTAAYK